MTGADAKLAADFKPVWDQFKETRDQQLAGKHRIELGACRLHLRIECILLIPMFYKGDVDAAKIANSVSDAISM